MWVFTAELRDRRNSRLIAHWILDDGSLQEFKVSDNALPKAIDAHGTIGAGSSFKVVGTGTYALDPTTGTVSEVSSVDNIYGSTRIAILSK